MMTNLMPTSRPGTRSLHRILPSEPILTRKNTEGAERLSRPQRPSTAEMNSDSLAKYAFPPTDGTSL